jgi:hypothetical protein
MFRDLFRFNFTVGIFELDPSAVAKMPVLAIEFREIRVRHLARIAFAYSNRHQDTFDTVINAQPK